MFRYTVARRSSANIRPEVLVLGGSGALGRAVVSAFASNNWVVHNIDVTPSPEARTNLLISTTKDIVEQYKNFAPKVAILADVAGEKKFRAVVNVAGGWAGGGLDSDLLTTYQLMANQSVFSSIFAAQVAHRHLLPVTSGVGSALILPGAQAAKGPTSFMIGYGMAKGAVHHLVKSIASDDKQLPAGGRVYAVLPITLDTPGNRTAMPTADVSTWTPLETAASDIFALATGKFAPPTGALLTWRTAGGKTSFTEEK